MHRLLLALLLILFTSTATYSQRTEWARPYALGSMFHAVIPSTSGNGEFFAVGNDSALSGPAADILVVRFAGDGTPLAARRYGIDSDASSFRATEAFDAVAVRDGFVVAGRQRARAFVMKLDRNGDSVWSATYGGTALSGHVFGVAQGPGDDIYVSLNVHDGIANRMHQTVLRLDAAGVARWSHTEQFDGVDWTSSFFDVATASDGGVVAIGRSLDTASFGAAMVYRLDSSGMLRWRTLIDSEPPTTLLRATALRSGGFAVVGWRERDGSADVENAVLLTLDSAGRQRALVELEGPRYEVFQDVVELGDGRLAIVGTRGAVPGARPNEAYHTLTIAAPTGTVLWDTAWRIAREYGVFRSLAASADDTLLTAGYAFDLSGSGSIERAESIVAKFSIPGTASSVTRRPESHAQSRTSMTATERHVIIELGDDATQARVTLFDILGRTLATLHDGPLAAGQHPFALPDELPHGTRFLVAHIDGGTTTIPVHPPPF